MNCLRSVFAMMLMTLITPLLANAQTREPSDTKGTRTEIRVLQEKRAEVLEQAVKLALRQYQEGVLGFQSVYATQRDWLHAKLDLAETRGERIKIVTSQLKLAKESLALSEARFRAGQTTQLEVFQAQAAALRVEIQLLKLRRPDKVTKPQ